jgi:hypothetical protein
MERAHKKNVQKEITTQGKLISKAKCRKEQRR